MKLALLLISLVLCTAQAAAQAVAAGSPTQAAASAAREAAKQAGVERLKDYDPAQRQKRTLLGKPQPQASPRSEAKPGGPAVSLCDGSSL